MRYLEVEVLKQLPVKLQFATDGEFLTTACAKFLQG